MFIFSSLLAKLIVYKIEIFKLYPNKLKYICNILEIYFGAKIIILNIYFLYS